MNSSVSFPPSAMLMLMVSMKDSDWRYRAISCPWLSDDPVNLVLFGGRGFSDIFDNESVLDADSRLALDGWEFVAFWKPAFAG